MNYSKPKVLAQNKSTGSFAAGCPTNNRYSNTCTTCELVK